MRGVDAMLTKSVLSVRLLQCSSSRLVIHATALQNEPEFGEMVKRKGVFQLREGGKAWSDTQKAYMGTKGGVGEREGRDPLLLDGVARESCAEGDGRDAVHEEEEDRVLGPAVLLQELQF